MSNQFATHARILALYNRHRTKKALHEAIIAAGIQNFETQPIPGFYRHRTNKGHGPLEAVGIWERPEDNSLVVQWAGKPALLEDVWPYALYMPIPREWYTARVNEGAPWPDIHIIEAVTLQDKIEKGADDARKYEKIENDDQCDSAQTLRSELLKLRREADKIREDLKRPHHEAGKKIDALYQPLIKAAQATSDLLSKWMGVYQTRKEQERQEALRAAAEEERARQEAAQQRQAETGEAPPFGIGHNEPPPEPVPAPVTTIKGGTGRAASVKTVEEAVDFVDWMAWCAYMREDADMRADSLRRAQKIINSTGEVPPGVKTETRRKVA